MTMLRQDYESLRARVAIHVCAKWTGTDDWTEEQMQQTIAAADEAYRPDACPLDWEEETLALMQRGGGDGRR